MFGYVKVCKPELKVREYEEYKAVYCTLCRVIGKEYGQTSRALLNYDATFYILLCDCAESGEAPQYQKGGAALIRQKSAIIRKTPAKAIPAQRRSP